MVCKILVGKNTKFTAWNKYIDDINSEHIIAINLKENIDVIDELIETNEINHIVVLYRSDYKLIYECATQLTKLICLDDDTWKLLRDKSKFNQHMIEYYANNIPKNYRLNNINIDDDINFPVIVKPNISCCGKNMMLCQDFHQLEKYEGSDIVQEFILDSYEYAANMFCDSGVIINYKITRQKYDEHHIKKTLFDPSKCEHVYDFDMTLFKDIIKHFNYSGGCCVDFKIQNDVVKIFEINPRFGGSAFTLKLFEDLITF
jgi:carbamoylphosphate synthase large subunit